MTFYLGTTELDLFDHPYNVTSRNERAVEIPVAKEFLRRYGRGRGLEVGNVLGHYGVAGHDVVDLYEVAEGVRNIDVFDVEGHWDWAVSISTLEHVGWPDDVDAASAALVHLLGLLATSGVLFVTVGLGQHTRLDDAIFTRAFRPDWQTVYRRDRGRWVPSTANPSWAPYDWRTPSARAVWMATFGGTLE